MYRIWRLKKALGLFQENYSFFYMLLPRLNISIKNVKYYLQNVYFTKLNYYSKIIKLIL